MRPHRTPPPAPDARGAAPAQKDATPLDIEKRRLTHLRSLEAESIHILREAVAEFENPVMLYSIGKDSSVMLRLAREGVRAGAAAVPAACTSTRRGSSGT